MKHYRTLLFAAAFTAVLLVAGSGLNPFDAGMFDFHDETQVARVLEFANNLRHTQIPPRIAPHFSFGMGYPVFNYYAPTAYWVTGTMNLAGIPATTALKLSFILAMIIGFAGMYLLVLQYADEGAALFSGMMYISSLYVAVDVYVRGNLSEVWFIGLFPLALYVTSNKRTTRSRLFFVFACVTVAATLGAHNLLSLLSIPVLAIYAAVTRRLRTGLMLIAIAMLINAYFFIPLFGESHLTYASDVARSTHYADHFLCAGQLWQSPWGYGGSAPGCDADGISFKVGKPQLMFFALGVVGFIAAALRKRRPPNAAVFFAALATVSLFLTTYWSKTLWDIAAPLAAVIQFPWRFIALSLVGISALPAIAWGAVPKFRAKDMLAVIAGIAVLAMVLKYFHKPALSPQDYRTKYESAEYISRRVAFRVSEYLPRTADYSKWKALDTNPLPKEYDFAYNGVAETDIRGAIYQESDDGFNKRATLAKDTLVKLNVHYMPYWVIQRNGKSFTPKVIDYMGRPVLNMKAGETISATYRQTPLEITADIISLTALIVITGAGLYKPLWKIISSSKA